MASEMLAITATDVAGVVEEEVDVVEHERVGRPEITPSGRERRRACCVLDWKEGYDHGQHVMGQAANDVLVVGIGDGGARDIAGSRREAG
jgi:hypothetical protein